MFIKAIGFWHELWNIDVVILYYIKVFVRILQKRKFFSAVHLLGLSAGIATSLLIFIYVSNQLSFDKFHDRANDIYRINQTFIWGDDNSYKFASTGPGVAVALGEEIPEFEEIVRIHTPGSFLISSRGEDRIISHQNDYVLAADSNFFKVFTFPFKFGDPKRSLAYPNSVVITEETSIKYFGDRNPIGESLEFGNAGQRVPYKITGVLHKIPENSYVDFDLLVSMTSFPRVISSDWSWIWTTFETYGLLKPTADIAFVEERLKDIPRKHAAVTLERVMGVTYDDYISSGKKWDLFIQQLTDIHLGSAYVYNRINTAGNQTTVYALIGVSIAILLLTCINYVNLKTSQYLSRAKESGMRKLLGANKTQVIFQHIFESGLYVAIAIIAGVIITYYSLDFFNRITSSNFTAEILFQTNTWIFLTALLVFMGLLNGVYPAITMSAFQPAEVVKGRVSKGKNTAWIRTSLVVVQFTLSIILVSSTLIVFKQLDYVYSKDVGFVKEGLISVNGLEWLDGKESFISEIKQISAITDCSLTTGVPPNVFNGDQFLSEENRDRTVPLNYAKVDNNYVQTLGANLRLGRNFSELDSANKDKVIVNAKAIKALGWNVNEEVIGKRIVYPGQNQEYTIIGVLDDFNFWSLNAPIEPLAIFHTSSSIFSIGRYYAMIRVENANVKSTVAMLQGLWAKQGSDVEFSYQFIDDEFAEDFQSEEQFKSMLMIFAGLAFLIAAMGMLGMILYSIERKIKEVSIKKVLGASTFRLVFELSRSYLLVIVLSFAISIPLTYFFMGQWLQNFEYRVPIEFGVFVLSGISVFLITMSLVGFQTLRAANTNPGNILKEA